MQLPSSVIKSLQGVKGFDEHSFRDVHTSGEQITSVRLNPNKIFPSYPLIQAGNKQYSVFNGHLERVTWCEQGYYLTQRPSFTLDPLFHAGAYYVQEASSMFLEEVLKQTADLNRSLRVLDLCAAPGGKSTLIQSMISPDSLLVSNEVIKSRVGILTENMVKWGSANVIITNNDPRDMGRLQQYFDVIVVDAPCSGSGLFRKDPSVTENWSEQQVQTCSRRQHRILEDVLPSLKKGGILIYSTCSYSPEENEDIADWLIERAGLSSVGLALNEAWNIVETQSLNSQAYGYRFYPDKLKGEGFFIAAFRNGEDNDPVKQRDDLPRQKNRADNIASNEINAVRPFLKERIDLFFTRQDEDLLAMPAPFQTDLMLLKRFLYLKKAGIKLGTVIRNELIPHHELALSSMIGDNVNRVEVDHETALNYLRRSEVMTPTEKKGWVLITYAGLPLGWIKILADRINNYYPSGWRILNK